MHDGAGLVSLLFQALKGAQRRRCEQRGHAGVELGAMMADLPCRLGRGERRLKHWLMGIEVQPGVCHLAAVGDLDAPKAVLCSELYATSQVAV